MEQLTGHLKPIYDKPATNSFQIFFIFLFLFLIIFNHMYDYFQFRAPAASLEINERYEYATVLKTLLVFFYGLK